LNIFAFWNIICIIYKEDLPIPTFILPPAYRQAGIEGEEKILTRDEERFS